MELRNKVRSCGIRKAPNVKQLLLRVERCQLPWVQQCDQNAPGMVGEAGAASSIEEKQV